MRISNSQLKYEIAVALFRAFVSSQVKPPEKRNALYKMISELGYRWYPGDHAWRKVQQ